MYIQVEDKTSSPWGLSEVDLTFVVKFSEKLPCRCFQTFQTNVDRLGGGGVTRIITVIEE